VALSARISAVGPEPPTTADLQGMALAVLASSPDCIKIISADGHIEYVSEGGRAALELECDGSSVLGIYWPEFWDDDHRPAVERAMRCAQRGEMARFEAFCPTARGTPKWWDVTVSPFRSDREGATKLLVISRDITASHTASAALAARAARQEMLYRLAAQLLNARDETQLLQTVISLAPEDLGIETCMAFDADAASRRLHLRHSHGISAKSLPRLRELAFGDFLSGRVAREERAIILSDIQSMDDPAFEIAKAGKLETFAGFPLFSETGDISGVLAFGSRSRTAFGTQDMSLLSAIVDMYATVVRRMRTKRALQESEDSLRLLINGARDHAIYKLDIDGRIASWNEGAERLHGYTADEMIGRPVACLYDEETQRSGAPEAALATARRGGSARVNGMRVRKDGTRFAAAGSIAALRGTQGELIGFAKVTQDISARVLQENALKTSESRLRAVVDTAVDAIVVIDTKGVIHSFNQAAEQMFGFSAAEMVGASVNQLMPASEASRHEHAMGNYLRSGVARVVGIGREVNAQRKDGSTFPVELALAEWRDAAGERFFTGLMRDMTELKEAERERREAHEAVLRASRLTALGAMASTIAHELNQPLTAMSNYMSAAQVALKTPGAEPALAIRSLDRGMSAARRVSEIITRMRSFAKNGQVQARPVNLAEVIAEAWDKVGHCCPAAGVRYRCDQAQPELMARADRTQIEQVLINLMRNAVEAMDGRPNRRLTVRVTADERMAQIAVIDTGPGLPEDRIADPVRLFSSSKPEGTGLGLPVCATIVEAHGGRLSAERAPGGGAAFLITLPLHVSHGPE
jgi:two-component system sensor kinase FixL